jgi:hypothetical protein
MNMSFRYIEFVFMDLCHHYGKFARNLYQQDRPIGFGELFLRFQPAGAATRRPASETNAFTTDYTGTESAVLFDECAIILAIKTFIKLVTSISNGQLV